MRIDEEEIVRAQEDGSLGQVISGRKYWSDGTPVAGQQFEYTFDDIGNRKTTASGGDQNGVNLRTANYTNNTLNQLTGRDVPGYLNILGSATNTATVTVNNTATSRKSAYYRAELTAVNTNALWFSVTNVAVRNDGTNADTVATSMGNVLLAKTPETFTYDADGNLASDGLWTNTWNAENRLISTESWTNVPTAARMKEEWSYLPDGRWHRRIVSTNNGTSWVASYTNRYVWDGKVLHAVLDHTNGLVMSFTRGIDLSGTEQGAGGVGGLLAVSLKTNGTHFAAYDGNGNVAGLLSGSDGLASATYEYDPFGQTIRITGPVAKLNPIRFSTQYADDVTGNLKYLYRDYAPSAGRWPNRDPINEPGFNLPVRKQGLFNREEEKNLYGFVRNTPVNSIDILGLATLEEESRWGYCCCGKAGRISAKAVPTGVKSCSVDSTVEGVNHGWLEIDGWSADFNTGGSIWWSAGTVNIPTDYAEKDSKKCEDVLLSPCRYDFKKFRANVKAEAEKDKANPPTYTVVPLIGDQCFSWRNGIINRAMQKSGPCGGEVSAE